MRRDRFRRPTTRTTPRLDALDDRTLPSAMAGAQFAAMAEHRAMLQQQREMRLEALQQRREMRLEALQQRREMRLEALQQRRAQHGFGAIPPTAQAGMPSYYTPSSTAMPPSMTMPAASTTMPVVTPVTTPTPMVGGPVLAGSIATPAAAAVAMSSPVTAATPTTADTPTTPAPQPVPKADPHLNAAYEDFLAANGGHFTTSQAGIIEVVGTSVGVDVHGAGGAALASELAGIGMTVQNVNAPTGVVEGLLPLADLPAAANLPDVAGISAIYVPKLNGML